MRERQPCVYMLASGPNGTRYVGLTSNLPGRLIQHRTAAFGGFTTRYRVNRLVYVEVAGDMHAAIAREKRYQRDWKRNLIERENPHWNDLAVSLGLELLNDTPGPAVDPGSSPG